MATESNKTIASSKTTASVENIAGIVVPDTPLVREVTDVIREAEDDLLFDHSRRVFLFGALQGRRLGLQPDLELLYVGAMFHDIGLTRRTGAAVDDERLRGRRAHAAVRERCRGRRREAHLPRSGAGHHLGAARAHGERRVAHAVG